MGKNFEIQTKIIDALKEKTGGIKPCAVCGNNNWIIQPSYVALSTTLDPRTVSFGGQVFPMLPLSCSKCGNTHFLNLLTLGFKNLEEIAFEPNDDKPK